MSNENKNILTEEEIKRVKGLGCLRDKRFPDVFNVRVLTRNGKLKTDEHRAVAEAADRFGSGEVAMTSRLTLEVQGVPYRNLDQLFSFLSEYGLESGGTGPKVRPIVSCKGTTCQYGLIDTFSLSEKIHDVFYKGYHDVTLPHKFKIGVGGCPNNCVKPDLNDLGIMGQKIPALNQDKCRGCNICQIEKSCPMRAVSIRDGIVVIDKNLCNNCGRCTDKCHFGAFDDYSVGYKIMLGGRWGKKVAQGRPMNKIFLSEDEVMAVIEKIILFYRDNGITGERFADTISRIGFDNVEKSILQG